MKPPFGRMEHLDLLYGARRLWKLHFDSCRLVELETQILGYERQDDVPGSVIPYLYFEYLRTRHAGKLANGVDEYSVDRVVMSELLDVVRRRRRA